MFSAPRFSPLIAAAVTFTAVSIGRAGDAADWAASALKEPAKPVTPAAPAPKREQVMSRDFAATLAGFMPAYNPPAKPSEPPPDLREVDRPKNGIIRLPKYELRVSKEPKPLGLTEADLLTPQGKVEIAMKRNPGLHIGNIFGWNQGIALMMYQEQLRLDGIAAMAEFANNARNSGDAAGAAAIALETNRAYYRPSDIGGGR